MKVENRIPATLIPGDGIGPEITESAVAILDALGAPFASGTLMLARASGYSGVELTWKWNLAYTAVSMAVLAGVYALRWRDAGLSGVWLPAVDDTAAFTAHYAPLLHKLGLRFLVAGSEAQQRANAVHELPADCGLAIPLVRRMSAEALAEWGPAAAGARRRAARARRAGANC